jgi:hypothetical protein
MFIFCNDVLPFIARLGQKGIGNLLRKADHAVVNLDNVIGDPAETGKLRNGIRAKRRRRDEYRKVADDYAGKDSQSHSDQESLQI